MGGPIIHKNAPNQFVFFEKTLTDNEIFPSGLTHAPGGAQYANTSVYSYHVYCIPNDETTCDLETTTEFVVSYNDADTLNTARFMTEFGASQNSSKQLDEISFLMNEADSKVQSYSYWQFKYFDDLTTSGPQESLYGIDGNLEVNKLATLSRTYLQATAGVPQYFHF